MLTSFLEADLPMIEAPEIEYALLAPLFIVTGVAVLGVLVEAFWPRSSRFLVQTVLAVLGIVAALVDTVVVYTDLDRVDSALKARGQVAGEGALSVDGPGVVTWGLLLVFGLLSMLLFAERRLEGGLSAFTERPRPAP
jgi:NADH-quinone oxidoreductase subunit N